MGIWRLRQTWAIKGAPIGSQSTTKLSGYPKADEVRSKIIVVVSNSIPSKKSVTVLTPFMTLANFQLKSGQLLFNALITFLNQRWASGAVVTPNDHRYILQPPASPCGVLIINPMAWWQTSLNECISEGGFRCHVCNINLYKTVSDSPHCVHWSPRGNQRPKRTPCLFSNQEDLVS